MAIPAYEGVVAFDCSKLDTLMREHGAGVVLATSGHNLRYLTGGYRSERVTPAPRRQGTSRRGHRC